jgi:hypothetical protein
MSVETCSTAWFFKNSFLSFSTILPLENDFLLTGSSFSRPVVYEKYNSLLSMNFNAELYKFSIREKNFLKFDLLLTFFQSLDQIK